MLGGREEITVVGARASAAGIRLLVADADAAHRQWLREAVAGAFRIDEVDQGAVALELIARGTPRLVVVGRDLADMTGGELIERAAQWLGERDTPMSTFLLADASGQTADVDESRVNVFYRFTTSMHATRVRELMMQAAATLPKEPPTATAAPPHIAELVQRIGAQQDAESAAREAIAAVMQLVGATRARCLYCDEETGMLWPEGEDGEHEAKASSGVAGFAVRTGASLAIPNVAEEPLYRAEIDDPAGTGRERLAVQPVTGLDGHVHAVLIAARGAQDPPFSPAEMESLDVLASAWAPYLQQLAMRAEAENILGDRLDAGPSDLFRQEAILSLVRRGARGDVVRVHPGWVRSAYWLVLASLAAAIAFAAFAKVHEHTGGAAIIRFTGRSDVVAFEPGTVTALEVTRGQVVTEGQALARLHDAEQLGRLRGLETEFERKLVAYLQTPADTAVRQALAQIVSDRESARAGVDAKVIRAPRAGLVKEVLVRNGQRVDAGTTVMSIVEQGTTEGLSVLAFLPGSQRPRLRPRQHLTLTLPGYRGARISTRVLAVSSEVLGANDARSRYLGDRVGESLPIQGTVVVVEAQLPSPTFEADGERYQLHDGMIGTVEIRLGSRSVLETVIPGLAR
jgi:multidrug efflux system membrane fusion protein